MGPVVPLVAAVAGSYATTAIGAALGSTLLGSIGGFIVSSAINQVGGSLLGKKPKAPSFNADAGGRTQVIRSSVESHKIIYGQVKVSGPLVFVETVDSGPGGNGEQVNGENVFLHLVLPLAGHEVEEIGQIFLNDQAVTLDGNGWVTNNPFTDSSGYKRARIYKKLGAADQTAIDDLVAQVPNWTAAHRLRGLAYIYARLQFSNDVFPLGIPNLSAVVKGKKVYDPRTGLTAWSDNAALCIRDYLTNDYGFNCELDEINDTYFIAAANICDENVTLKAGGTQKRYTANGVVDTAVAPLQNLDDMKTALAGEVTYVQGRFRLHAGAYDSPSVTVNEDMLAGPIKIRARPPRKELFNAVRGTYVDPAKQWQPTDFPFITNAIYEAQDGGERIFKDIELPFTTEVERAQRIAKIALERRRQGITCEMSLNHSGMQIAAYDTISVTNAQMGWGNKVFRVLKWSTDGIGPINLVLQEDSSASYNWNSGEATLIDAAPDTNLPSPFTVTKPGVPSVTEELYSTRNGSGVKSRAIVSWSPSTDAFLRRYVLEYKLSSSSAWTVLPTTEATTVTLDDLAPGTYDFRVKAKNNLDVSSDYAEADPKEIFGLSARPADISSLNIQTVSSLAVLRWAQSVDLDVREGGKILIRHSEELTPSWENSYSIGEELGDATFSLVPLKPGTYMVKAQDSSGLTSVNFASTTTKNASVLTFSNIATIQEDSGFTGTHSNTVVDGAILKISGAGLFDDITDFDSIPSLDDFGGVSTSGTYTFASGTNNGSVKKVRLRSTIELTTINVNDLIDSRTSDIDDWPDFDGTSGGGTVDCYVEVRETDNDPTGSPTWSAWKRMDAADYEAWGLQYRAVLTSSDPAFNVNVSKLRVHISEVV